MNWERVAVIGTAQSHVQTPWQDTTLLKAGLNDSYKLKGFGPCDLYYDLHPLDKLWAAQDGQRVYQHEIPPGYYVRPHDHFQWLKAQTIPVFLHPDYLTQYPDAVNWPTAQPFPRDAIMAEFGKYFGSSPAWMIAHAVLNGVRELAIYGIHLASEREYIEQRPNFEYLIGRVLGRGKLTTTTVQGLRHYETPDGHVILPEASPILSAKFQYAFESRPDAGREALMWELHKITVKRQRVTQQFMTTRFGRKKLKEQDLYLAAWMQDVQEQLARMEH